MQLVRNDGGGPGSVRLASAAGRWVLAVAVLGEAMVLLEATVVNVALPAIGRDLRAGVAGLQWTLDGYVLTAPGAPFAWPGGRGTRVQTIRRLGHVPVSVPPGAVLLGRRLRDRFKLATG